MGVSVPAPWRGSAVSYRSRQLVHGGSWLVRAGSCWFPLGSCWFASVRASFRFVPLSSRCVHSAPGLTSGGGDIPHMMPIASDRSRANGAYGSCRCIISNPCLCKAAAPKGPAFCFLNYKHKAGFRWYYQNVTCFIFASVEVEGGLLRSRLLHRSGARSSALQLCKLKRANPSRPRKAVSV